jgi:hypothetical protein
MIGEVATTRDIISIFVSMIAVFLIMKPQVTADIREQRSLGV